MEAEDQAYKRSFEGIPQEWFDVERKFNKDTGYYRRVFICRVNGCNKVFTKSCNMKDHFRTHDGRKPYMCHLCNSSYTQAGNLKKHYLRDHPNEDMQLLPHKVSTCKPKSLLGKRKAESDLSDILAFTGEHDLLAE